MQNKKNVKTIILLVLVVAAVAAAFAIGSSFGKNQNNHTNIPDERPSLENGSSSDSTQTESISDSIFNLVTALDDYIEAPVQQAEAKVEFGFGSLEIDEEFSLRSGVVNDIQVNHIQRGKLDIYVCDGKVFVEDDNAHFKVNNSSEYNVNMRQIFAFAYEIIKNGEFAVSTAGEKTEYSLTLTQQQIENILNAFHNTMENFDVKIEKGVLKITLENGELDSFDVICSGHTEILSAQIDGYISVGADLSVSQQQITIPQAIAEQLK